MLSARDVASAGATASTLADSQNAWSAKVMLAG
jgi:hypothetical protein